MKKLCAWCSEPLYENEKVYFLDCEDDQLYCTDECLLEAINNKIKTGRAGDFE